MNKRKKKAKKLARKHCEHLNRLTLPGGVVICLDCQKQP